MDKFDLSKRKPSDCILEEYQDSIVHLLPEGSLWDALKHESSFLNAWSFMLAQSACKFESSMIGRTQKNIASKKTWLHAWFASLNTPQLEHFFHTLDDASKEKWAHLLRAPSMGRIEDALNQLLSFLFASQNLEDNPEVYPEHHPEHALEDPHPRCTLSHTQHPLAQAGSFLMGTQLIHHGYARNVYLFRLEGSSMLGIEARKHFETMMQSLIPFHVHIEVSDA